MKIIKPFGKATDKTKIRISVCEQNIEIVNAIASLFKDISDVEVLAGNIFNLKADAIVSPANSFGDMSGGIDKQIDDFYNGQAQEKVIKTLRDNYLGELPVGSAHIVSMQTGNFPFLIVAPTMRIPGKVADTINPYLAMRAILIETLKHNHTSAYKIKTIAMSGLCTGVGRMPYQEAALQMRVAYDNVIGEKWKDVVHPALAPFALKPSE